MSRIGIGGHVGQLAAGHDDREERHAESHGGRMAMREGND
jgi:hypothetical protein